MEQTLNDLAPDFFSTMHLLEESGAESIGLWRSVVCTMICFLVATYCVRMWLNNCKIFFTRAQFQSSWVGPRNSARCQTCLLWAVDEIKKSDGSLQINRDQCQLLSAECQRFLQRLILDRHPLIAKRQRLIAECQCMTRLLCKPSLCRRLCAVRNALKLVQDCCTENWLLKAVELGNCQEHFREVLLDLQRLNEPTVDRFDATGIDHETVMKDMLAAYESDKTELKKKVQSKYEQGHYLANQLMEEPPVSAPPEISKHLENFDISKTPLYPVVDVDREGDQTRVVVFRVTHASKEFIVKMRWSESKSKNGPELVQDGPEPLQIEANTMKRCRHPYTVGLVGYWEVTSRDPMVPLLLMESMDCNLRELIDKRRSKTTFFGLWGGTRGFPALYAINLVLPVAKALWHLHSIKVVHRDLKPQNILYTHVSETQHLPDYFSVKLADFGDARNVEDSVVAAWKAGTNGYMDPDVYYSRKNIDLYKADVFSFGLVFGEVLTGVSPAEALYCMSDTVVHGGHSPFVLANKFYDKLERKGDRPGDRPPLPKNTPKFVKSIVEKCCHPVPAERPSFETICKDLLQCVTEL